jgi:hypothetical protein
MDRLGTPAKVRQERLGHVDFDEMTLGVYTHAASLDHREVAEKLGAMLAPEENSAR